jgi:hypothetical protein
MGLLQEIADAIGGDKLNKFQKGEGDFENQSSSDQTALQDLIKRIDPKQLQQVLAQSAKQVDPQEYADHVTPGVGDTDPLGQLKGGGLASIAAVLLNQLKQAGSTSGTQVSRIPGVQTTDPNDMDPNDVAAIARYTQENHPEAFGKAAAEIGQKQPGLLHSFLGKAAMAAAAAALASHFIKMDRKAPK